MMKSKIVLVTGVALVLVALGAVPSAIGAGRKSNGPAVPNPNATLTVAQTSGPAQFNPAKGASLTQDYCWMSPIYDRLVQLSGDQQIEPMLATSWAFSKNGKQLTMQLRQGVKFSDGTPFNAAAVVTNINYVKSVNGVGAQYLATIASAVATGTYSVRFNLTGNQIPNLLYSLAAAPEADSMISPTALANPSSLSATPVGSGLYTLTSFTPGTSATYTKVASYWDKALWKQAPAKIINEVIVDDNARVAALQTGQIDAMTMATPLPNISSILSGSNGTIKLVSYAGNRAVLLNLNLNKAPLQNQQVRQAISLAIDRTAICKSVLLGVCVPTVQPFGKGFIGYSKVLAKAGVAANPTRAKSLLKAATGGAPISLSLITVPTVSFQNTATAVQAELENLGIHVDLSIIPGSTINQQWNTGKYDLFLGASTGYQDPYIGISGLFGTEQNTGILPGLQTAASNASALPWGGSRRTRAWQAFSNFIVTNPQFITLYIAPNQFLTKSYVHGVLDGVYNKVQLNWDVRHMWVAKH